MKGSDEGPVFNRRGGSPAAIQRQQRQETNTTTNNNNNTNNYGQANDEVMEVFGDTTTNVVVTILGLLAWLSAYTAYQHCTC